MDTDHTESEAVSVVVALAVLTVLDPEGVTSMSPLSDRRPLVDMVLLPDAPPELDDETDRSVPAGSKKQSIHSFLDKLTSFDMRRSVDERASHRKGLRVSTRLTAS